MRLSDFTILSDRLANGDRILMNGASGALDVVPRPLADHLQGIQVDSARGHRYVDADRLHPETVASLLERGHLTRMTPDQERTAVTEIARGLHEQEKRRPYFMIAPSMDCNYRCVYCFERPLQAALATGRGGGGRPGAGVLMDLADVPRVLECIGQIQARAGAEPGGMIILYGGEPLDARNRNLVMEIVHAGRARGHFFVAVTNGHELDQFRPIVGPEMIRQIQISFDGPKPLHDRRRIALDGSSSFDRLVSNIRGALEIDGVEVHLRVHVEPTTIDHFGELIRLFEDEGWTDHPAVIIYVSTIYQKDVAGQVCARVDVADLAERLDIIASRYRNVLTSAPAVHVARSLWSIFESGRRYPLKGDYCSANFGNYIFAPDGDIYACWESVGKACSRIGTYRRSDGPQFDDDAVRKWFDRSVATVAGCLDCEFALVCGGGCAQYAEYNTGSSSQRFCDDFQRTFRRTLAEEAARFYDRLGVLPLEAGDPTMIGSGERNGVGMADDT
jgi:uncharacterized protein